MKSIFKKIMFIGVLSLAAIPVMFRPNVVKASAIDPFGGCTTWRAFGVPEVSSGTNVFDATYNVDVFCENGHVCGKAYNDPIALTFRVNGEDVRLTELPLWFAQAAPSMQEFFTPTYVNNPNFSNSVRSAINAITSNPNNYQMLMFAGKIELVGGGVLDFICNYVIDNATNLPVFCDRTYVLSR
jgi:hypothetical protein